MKQITFSWNFLYPYYQSSDSLDITSKLEYMLPTLTHGLLESWLFFGFRVLCYTMQQNFLFRKAKLILPPQQTQALSEIANVRTQIKKGTATEKLLNLVCLMKLFPSLHISFESDK